MKKFTFHFTKKKIAFFSFLVFSIWLTYLFIRFRGYYAYDEFYHISSSDEQFHHLSQYRRAPYLNEAVRFLTSLLGRHYYTYKFIPWLLSLISAGIFFYLLSKFVTHVYSIILFLLLFGTHCLLVYNHLCVRMYICDEAVIAILVFLLYFLAQVKTSRLRILIHILYFIVSTFLLIFQPSEQSSIAVCGVGIVAWLCNTLGEKISPLLKDKKYILYTFCLSVILLTIMEIFIIAVRKGTIPIPIILKKVSTLNTSSIDIPYFTLYFLTQNIFLTIGLIGFSFKILKTFPGNKDNIIGIYSLGLIPFLAYNMLFFDSGPFRAFNAYLPVIIFITILWIDSFQRTIIVRSLSTIAVIITILLSSPDKKMLQFYQIPYIYRECFFNNYGALISQAKHELDSGRKCISIWANEHQQAGFELNTEYSFALENSINVSNGYTEKDLSDLMNYLETSDEQYILLIGTHTSWRLNSISTGYMEKLCNKYSYKKYGLEDAFLFYIN